ncbi:MAG: transglutaminase domain-containing protein [Akkermansiaceae bacterium]|nr:transglutaminase domain-containing protein [Akkermansiaceae bacterium]
MRSLTLIIAVAGAYALLRGWQGCPSILMRACLAVATLVAGLAFWGIRKDASQPRMLSLRKATWLDYLSLGAAVVFTEACFVVLTSTLAAPAQELVAGFREVIADPAKLGNGDDGDGPGGGDGDVQFDGERSGDWKFSKRMDRNLPPNSNHKPSNKPEVFLELENQEDATALFNSRIHLRSFAFSRFNGVSWSARRKSETLLKDPIVFPRPPGVADKQGIRYRIYHAVSRSGQNLFTSLHGTHSTDLAELTELAESIHLLPEVTAAEDGYTYTATSHSIHFTDLINEPIHAAPGSPDELDLPPEFADPIKKTAEAFIYQPTLSSQLVALRNFLQDNYTYSLETTNATGANPLENFLYLEKRGYCEHFATAAAMLCRTLGVPSRIAYGWSGGRLYKEQNMFVFRAKDAHAWTEIKLDGYGWVVFDTTPADNAATPEAHAAPDGEEAPDPAETIMEQQHALENEPRSPLSLDISPWALATGLVTAAICCAIFLVTRALHRPPTAPDGRPLRHSPPGYLVHFKQACVALGYPMPIGRTLRQQLDLLQHKHASPGFAQSLLDYHYGRLYADHAPDPATERQLDQAIRKWKNAAMAKTKSSPGENGSLSRI